MRYAAGYPECVEQYVNKLIVQPEVGVIFEDFEIKDEGIFFEEVCKLSFQRFVDDNDVTISEFELLRAATYTLITETINQLENEGVINNINNSDNPQFILSEKGQKENLLKDICYN